MLKRFFLVIILLVLPVISVADEFIAGKDYEEIPTQIAAHFIAKKVSVIEFFSYGCPACYRIDQKLTHWVGKESNVIDFSRVPVVFSKEWIFYAKAYYMAQMLGLEPKLSPLLFKAIQEEKQVLTSNAAMIDFLTAQNVDKSTVTSAFERSTTIDMQVDQGMKAMVEFHVDSIPALVVDYRYKTDLKMASNEERLFKILDFLIKKSSNENKS